MIMNYIIIGGLFLTATKRKEDNYDAIVIIFLLLIASLLFYT